MSRARREDETFIEYRDNLKKEAKELKEYLKGHLFWDSRKKGTYYRKNLITLNKPK